MSEALNEIGKANGTGGCRHCGDRWNWKPSHVTEYDGGSGCFPLCQACWVELGTPEARWPHYEAMIAEWERAEADAAKAAPAVRRRKSGAPQTGPLGDERRELVRAAVWEGK